MLDSKYNKHCVKNVRIRNFSGPHFPAVVVNTGKNGPEKVLIRTLFTQGKDFSPVHDLYYN